MPPKVLNPEPGFYRFHNCKEAFIQNMSLVTVVVAGGGTGGCSPMLVPSLVPGCVLGCGLAATLTKRT